MFGKNTILITSVYIVSIVQPCFKTPDHTVNFFIQKFEASHICYNKALSFRNSNKNIYMEKNKTHWRSCEDELGLHSA